MGQRLVCGEYLYLLVIVLQSVHSFGDSHRTRALEFPLVGNLSHCTVVFLNLLSVVYSQAQTTESANASAQKWWSGAEVEITRIPFWWRLDEPLLFFCEPGQNHDDDDGLVFASNMY
jgi:hypothetical protein